MAVQRLAPRSHRNFKQGRGRGLPLKYSDKALAGGARSLPVAPARRLRGGGQPRPPPTYLRLLDRKRLGNYRIYNRPVWGILYKETFNDIRFEFSAWLRKNLADSIRESYQQS